MKDRRPRRLGSAFALAAALAAGAPPAAACTRDAIMVFDGSGSMETPAADPPHRPRIDDARAALDRALPDVVALRRVGVLIYGPGPLGACENVNLAVAPTQNLDRILGAIGAVRPDGDTPLTRAVEAAATALSPEGIVVLITDGRETCGGGTCALAARLATTAPGITVHVIGFKVWENFSRWPGYAAESGSLDHEPARCLADDTGGRFVNTDTVDELTRALRDTLGCPLIGHSPGEASGSSFPTPIKANLKG
ncbi:MAG: VWA domain-containing protein [Pseudomonadota bacterium]